MLSLKAQRLAGRHTTRLILGAVVATLFGTAPFLAAQEAAAADELFAGMERTVTLNINTTGERRHVTNTRGMPFGCAAVLAARAATNGRTCIRRPRVRISPPGASRRSI